jgi:carboxylesterase type B
LPSLGFCVHQKVALAYGEYIGQPLINGITQWLGMRYAAPPVGDLRFKPPQDPQNITRPHQANTVRKEEKINNQSPRSRNHKLLTCVV